MLGGGTLQRLEISRLDPDRLAGRVFERRRPTARDKQLAAVTRRCRPDR